jgi:hypothetical protein
MIKMEINPEKGEVVISGTGQDLTQMWHALSVVAIHGLREVALDCPGSVKIVIRRTDEAVGKPYPMTVL